jgi:hypothetical protein
LIAIEHAVAFGAPLNSGVIRCQYRYRTSRRHSGMITPSKALFVLPSIQWDGDSVSVRGTIVDKATLRYAALYWDWVRVPVPLGPAQDAIDDYIELENSGFLHPHFPSEERIRAAFQDYATQRWGLTIGTLTMNRVHLNHLRMIFPDRRAAVEPERDAPLMLAALRESLAVIEEDGTYAAGYDGPKQPNVVAEGRALEFRLYQALGVPQDASIAELLEFRIANQRALADFRGYMDEIHAGVLASPDRDWAHDAAIRKVKAAIRGIDAEMTKKRWRRWKLDVATQINVTKGLAAAIAAANGMSTVAGGLLVSLLPDLLKLTVTRDKMLPSNIESRLSYYVNAQSLR